MSDNHWYPAYVGIGSNLDGPARQVESAFGLLDEIPDTRLTQRSALYRSSPFGGVEQPDFVNAVAAVVTRLVATDLLAEMQQIQRARGRIEDEVRWGPRVLDLDMLVFSDQLIDTEDLTVPHPGIGERNFVLLPLRELAPDLFIPGLGQLANIAVSDEPAISRIG